MDKSSLGYAYRGGASDVERTLKTLATGVGDSHTAMAEVSIKSVTQVYWQFCLVLKGSIWNEKKGNL